MSGEHRPYRVRVVEVDDVVLVDARVPAVGLAGVDRDAPVELVAGLLGACMRQHPAVALVDALPDVQAEVATGGGDVEQEDASRCAARRRRAGATDVVASSPARGSVA